MTEEKVDKRRTRGEETYRAILRSAMEIISEYGVGGITASRLSEKSGISKSSIFHHFRSTGDVPEALLDMIFEEMMHPLETSEAAGLEEYLDSFGRVILEGPDSFMKIYKTFFSFYHESMFVPRYREKMTAYLESSLAHLSGQLKRFSKKGLTDREAGTYAALIIATLDGIGLHILISGDREKYYDVWKEQVRGLCALIQA